MLRTFWTATFGEAQDEKTANVDPPVNAQIDSRSVSISHQFVVPVREGGEKLRVEMRAITLAQQLHFLQYFAEMEALFHKIFGPWPCWL